MSKINFYYAYGLFIASTIIFPELSSSNSSDYDISIKFGRKGIFPIKPNKKGSNITKYNINDIGFIFNGKTVFRVRYGKEILINPDVELHEVLLRSLILGQGMGILLHQKGYLVIHGSAVNINGFDHVSSRL